MEEINQLEYKLKKSKENLQADIANRRIDKIDNISIDSNTSCLLYTSDAADE